MKRKLNDVEKQLIDIELSRLKLDYDSYKTDLYKGVGIFTTIFITLIGGIGGLLINEKIPPFWAYVIIYVLLMFYLGVLSFLFLTQGESKDKIIDKYLPQLMKKIKENKIYELGEIRPKTFKEKIKSFFGIN